jgi:hypothetical protein
MTKGFLKIAGLFGAGAIFALLFSISSLAQTVRPVVNELSNPAKGRVEYVNDGLLPLNVVLEAKSFTVSETGEISYRPLDPQIHLKFSTTSFRIQPQQTYYVFYEATSPQAPAWFVIYASFSGFPFRTAQGMNVRLQLPHTVYLLPKKSMEKPDLQIDLALLSRSDNKVRLEVENKGDFFGRVLETQLVYSKKKQEAPGFPLFPHSKRVIEVVLDEKADSENVPVDYVFQFQNFKVEGKLQAAPTVASASTNASTIP